MGKGLYIRDDWKPVVVVLSDDECKEVFGSLARFFFEGYDPESFSSNASKIAYLLIRADIVKQRASQLKHDKTASKASKSKRIPISLKKRFAVFERDNFTCQYCGAKAPDVELEVDHIVPVSKGGSNDTKNLTTSCWECNRGKRDRIVLRGDPK